ncbi:DUF1467 family protein [Cohaesibacter celericrescens]|jgi:predicted secreted protein|uniref:DUF1467 domain-containing protein n=1 Tax=Cohaesibacter celericrescens TaxID=2067669 RepID=A0A2N5XSJ9_9HYPH|nr:DUF1467 family protein [Cohaesibacter celericrescens]PLW77482.1 DUF1467 domain-containing protein [Cohaesibacter celericrescens]
MTLASGLAVYFIIWWISLFLVLPFGVKTQAETEGDDMRLGTAPSAPAKAMMLRKILATTVLASLLFGAFYWAVEIMGLGLDDLTFMPMPDDLR